ncbi:hypothetical protein Tco_1016903 [Tanacetum coccineum]|uniref:Uncharacterized protein n=1 Tax=Tanacetum coccineum TaxID=301880 RepID=A0ABQ5FR99_9ASTR
MMTSKLPSLIGIRSISKGWFNKIRVQPWMTFVVAACKMSLSIIKLSFVINGFLAKNMALVPDLINLYSNIVRCPIGANLSIFTKLRMNNKLICQEFSYIMVLLPSVDLTGDEDPTNENGDIGMGDSIRVSVSLGGGISLGGKKYRESNIGDSGNTRDGGKTGGGSIGAYGGIGGSLAAH